MQLTTFCTDSQERGHRVCVIERNELRGRTQEWNISRHELEVSPTAQQSNGQPLYQWSLRSQSYEAIGLSLSCGIQGNRLVQGVIQKGLITAAEIEQAIVTEFNPTRISFKGSKDIWVNDVLNIGVSPR